MSLREAGISLIDCDHRTPPASNVGYPYIAIPQLKHGRLDLSDVRRITCEHFLDWTRKANPRHHDVILSRRCNPGETAVVPSGLECALGQNLVLLRADGTKVFAPFLRWLVRSPLWWEQVRTFINVGAVFDSLKCSDIPNFRLPIPSIPEQEAIARILGNLDDKIELNQRMNKTLDAIAKAIFKSWFVDFDPVRAKMEGRSPVSMGIDTARLFPNTLEDNEIGEIPSQWTVMPAGEVARAVGGATPSTQEPDFWTDGTHAWATPKDLSGLPSPILLATERKITDAGLRRISSGLLPSGTLLLSSRAPVGYVAITQIPIAINQGFIAMVCDGPVSAYYMLNWVYENMQEIVSRATGTTFQEISKQNFRPIPVLVPCKPIMDAFDQLVAPFYKMIINNLRESQTLTELRDALLPKLLSGEIRVGEAEKLLEAV